MANTIKILFWVFRSKANKQGLSPLMLRITYKNQRKQVYTGYFLDEKKWNGQKYMVKGQDQQAQQSGIYI